MKAASLAGCLCFAFGSCAVDPTLPPRAQVACTKNADCPSDRPVCRTPPGQCVAKGGDVSPPAIVEGSVTLDPPPPWRGGLAVTVGFTTTKDMATDPIVRLGTPEVANFTRASVDGRTYGYSYDVVDTLTEGAWPLLVSLADTDGLAVEAINLGTVVLDFTGPEVAAGSAVISFLPPGDCPLVPSELSAVGRDGSLYVGFAASEVLETPPVVRLVSAETSLPLSELGGAGVFWEYQLDCDAADVCPSGEYTLLAHLRDPAGNENAPAPGQQIGGAPIRLVDETPTLIVDQGEISFLRAPWGLATPASFTTTAFSPVSYFELAPAEPLTDTALLPASAFALSDGSPLVALRVLDQDGGLLATLRPTSSGALPRTPLPRTTTPRLSLVALDGACQQTDAIGVHRSYWVGNTNTLAADNPGELTAALRAPVSPRAVPLDRVYAWEVFNPAALAAPDGVAEAARTARLWPVHPFSATNPGPRARGGMVFDSLRDRVVLFGGENTFNIDCGENAINTCRYTWEWDGERWHNRTPAAGGPAPRSGHAMVYDPARGRTLMWGGNEWNDCLEGAGRTCAWLWSWDGDVWTVLDRDMPAGARSASLAAFDTLRGRLVIHAGGMAPMCGQTYEWDGSAWYEMLPSPVFPDPCPTTPSGGAPVAFDPLRGRVVTFGGLGFFGMSYLDATWEWDGVEWHNVTPAVGNAPARAGHVMYFDEARGELVVAGGRDSAGRRSDLWSWNGERWAEVVITGAAPAPRTGASAAYDGHRQRLILFGGLTQDAPLAFRADTWVLADDRWHDASTTATFPVMRNKAALAYDPIRDMLVLHGGEYSYRTFDCAEPSGELCAYTWTWTHPGWQSFSPSAGQPVGRASPAMAFSPAAGGVILFGGWRNGGDCGEGAGQFCSGTWLWEGASWRNVTPAASPYGRAEHALALDSVRDRVVLFGGATYPDCGEGTGGMCNRTWEWNGSAWQDVTPTTSSPTPRARGMMAFDAARGEVVLFGGEAGDCGEDGGTYCGHTWTWNGTRWLDATPVEGRWQLVESQWQLTSTPARNPLPRSGGVMQYDARRQRIVLAGGYNGAGQGCSALDEPQCNTLWEWDGTSWRNLSDSVVAPPTMSSDMSVAWDAGLGRIVMAGYTCTDGCNGLAGANGGAVRSYDADLARRPAFTFWARFGGHGLPAAEIEGVRLRAWAGARHGGGDGAGAMLDVWQTGGADAGHYATVAVHTTGLDGDGSSLSADDTTLLAWDSAADQPGRNFVLPGEEAVVVRVAPSGGATLTADDSAGEPMVGLDYLEVWLRY